MEVLNPKRFCSVENDFNRKKKKVPSLVAYCLKSIEKNKGSFNSFGCLSTVVLHMLFDYFEARFSLDEESLKKFLCTNLLFLRVKDRSINQELFESTVSSLSHISSLEVWDIDVKGDLFVKCVESLEKLSSLSIRNLNCISDDNCLRIFNANLSGRIQTLVLVGMQQLSNKSLQTFSQNCQSLSSFVVENNQSFTSDLYSEICKTAGKSLKELCCNSCNVGNNLLLTLAKCNENVTKLQLHDADVNDKGICSKNSIDVQVFPPKVQFPS